MRETLEQLVARVNASAFLPSDVGDYIKERTVAKPVKLKQGSEFTFRAAKSGFGSKYPWDDWFSGDLLMIEQAVGSGVDDKGNVTGITDPKDFSVSVDAMVPKLKTAARRRYKHVDVSRFDVHGKRLEGALIIRARDMTPDERTEEDVKRAEEAEAAKERRAKGNGATHAHSGEHVST